MDRYFRMSQHFGDLGRDYFWFVHDVSGTSPEVLGRGLVKLGLMKECELSSWNGCGSRGELSEGLLVVREQRSAGEDIAFGGARLRRGELELSRMRRVLASSKFRLPPTSPPFPCHSIFNYQNLVSRARLLYVFEPDATQISCEKRVQQKKRTN